MNTKTLVVGQEVYIESGCYGYMGKVVEVSPSSVSVETDGGRFRFSNNGKECDINGKEYDVGFGKITDLSSLSTS